MNKIKHILFFIVVFSFATISFSFVTFAKSSETLTSLSNVTPITSKSFTLKSGKYIVNKSLTLKAKDKKINALSIPEKSKVLIFLKKGCTLKLYGKNGVGKKNSKKYSKSGAALYLPSSSSLTIIGEGKLEAYGGNASDDAYASAGIGTNGGYYSKKIKKKSVTYKLNSPKACSNKIYISSSSTIYAYGGKINQKNVGVSIGRGSTKDNSKKISKITIWDIDGEKKSKVFSPSHLSKTNNYNYTYIINLDDLVSLGAYNFTSIINVTSKFDLSDCTYNCASNYKEDVLQNTASVFGKGDNIYAMGLMIISFIVMLFVVIKKRNYVEKQ